MLGELELRRRDREPGLAAGHRGEPLALADRVGQVLVEHARPASACSRTGRSATGRRSCAGRWPASPWGRSAAGPASRRSRPGRGSTWSAIAAAGRAPPADSPGPRSQAQPGAGRRSAGASSARSVRESGSWLGTPRCQPLVIDLVEVQDQVGDHRPGRQLARVERRVGLGLADGDQLLGGRRRRLGVVGQVGPEGGRQLGQVLRRRACGRSPAGTCKPAARRSSSRPRAGSARPGPARPRRTAARSSSSSAWSGVLVRSRRTMQASREGASKVVICGGGAVRFQKV